MALTDMVKYLKTAMDPELDHVVSVCVKKCTDTAGFIADEAKRALHAVCVHVTVCCSVLQCVAGCCGVLKCVAVCYGVLRCVTLCYFALQFLLLTRLNGPRTRCVCLLQCAEQCVSVFFGWCSMLQCVAVCSIFLHCVAVCIADEAQRALHAVCVHVTVCCSVLQCFTVCCGLLRCVEDQTGLARPKECTLTICPPSVIPHNRFENTLTIDIKLNI